jgi:hypothetical protein
MRGASNPANSTLPNPAGTCQAAGMMKKLLPLVLLPLMLAGCTSTFTNLTPLQQPRNPNNLYPVEVAFNSRQQSLRWDSIQPQVALGSEFIPMHPTPLMKNRWEALIPVPADTSLVRYKYKFDFKYNALGPQKDDSASSPEYTLRIGP